MEIIQIGNLVSSGRRSNPQYGRVYLTDGLCPTLMTCGGGERQPKIIVEVKRENYTVGKHC